MPIENAEVADGSLDLDDKTRRALDVVVVAIHSRLDRPPREQTRRVVRALTHPAVDLLAHPTGRLLGGERRGGRRGAALDLAEVYRAAAGQGVLLEVDAQPDRLDLDDVACRGAIAHGVRIAVDTDAHATAELRFIRWGIDQARRGWATPDAVVNTRPLAELLALLHGARG